MIVDSENSKAHQFQIQVYWEDTDAGGIVYYANYLKFTERARTELLRELGINQQNMMEEDGLNFVVRECHVEYLNSAKLDDKLTVETRLIELKGATMRMSQDISLDGQPVVKSQVRIACLKKNGRPARFSPQIRDRIASLVDMSGDTKT